LIWQRKINTVNILSESGLHAKHTIDIVRKYRKLTLEDADKMIRACDEEGVKLFVVKQNRYNIPVMKLRKALEEGDFGKLVMGSVRVRWCRPQHYYDQASWRGTWAMDGGVFTNQASHHVDLLEWMLGEPISVFAKSRTALVEMFAIHFSVIKKHWLMVSKGGNLLSLLMQFTSQLKQEKKFLSDFNPKNVN